jgi:hypothetical protein
MRDGDSAFSHHFHEIAIREPKRDVPPHAQDDELLLEATALEERIGIVWRSRHWWDTSGVADQTAFSSARSSGRTNRRPHMSIIWRAPAWAK